MIAEAIREQLAGVGVPVLLPHEVEAVVTGQKPGQKRGIPGYLEREAPDGYVQIEQPLSIGADGLTGTFWVAVSAVALTSADALALAMIVRRLLAGWPYAPGRYRVATEGVPLSPDSGATHWVHRTTYEAKTLDGQLA